MHINVRHFASGMISVNSTYNPEIIAMFKKWMHEGRGSYNPKYKILELLAPIFGTGFTKTRRTQ